MKKAVCFTLLIIASLLLITAMLFTCLQFCINQRDWYYKSYVKYGTSRETGISDEDMTEAIFRLIDYMEGRADSIQLSVSENGSVVEMYNQQEIEHMIDVRALYQAWKNVRDYGAAAAAAIIALCICMTAPGGRIRLMSRAFITASAIFGIALAALGIWVAVDFNSFWNGFHRLFFTNDLWLMDYNTCRMIRICPLQLFNDMVIRFSLMFMAPFLLLLIFATAGARRRQK